MEEHLVNLASGHMMTAEQTLLTDADHEKRLKAQEKVNLALKLLCRSAIPDAHESPRFHATSNVTMSQ